jgi:BlaI family penicillinase repressor
MKKRKPANRLPQISDAEWTVMQVAWDRGAVTANQVVDTLDGRVPWKPKTVQTLLRRLVEKGALTFEKRGREYVFQPCVSASDCRHAASRSFMDRVFDGRVAPLLSCFMEHEAFTPKEIEELKRILDGKPTS